MRAKTTATEDFADRVEKEWDASFPERHLKSVPAVMRLMRFSQHAAEMSERAFEAFGMTRGEGEVLSAIVRSPEHALNPKAVRANLVVSSGGLSARIAKLEEKRLIERLPDPNDKRGAILRATPEGIARALEAHAAHTELERRMIEVLSEEERSILEAILKKLVATVK